MIRTILALIKKKVRNDHRVLKQESGVSRIVEKRVNAHMVVAREVKVGKDWNTVAQCYAGLWATLDDYIAYFDKICRK